MQSSQTSLVRNPALISSVANASRMHMSDMLVRFVCFCSFFIL
jgi:hypothetical protein